jgi:hypothetical protein
MRLPIPIRLILAASTLLAVGSSAAVAKPQFSRDIESHLGLTYRPPCRLCHIQGTTGAGSVQTPFGISMLGHGLTESQKTVPDALDGLAADATDSDGDGTSDVAELSANKDPNTVVDVALGSDDRSPGFGCGVAPQGAADGATGVGLAALLTALGFLVTAVQGDRCVRSIGRARR